MYGLALLVIFGVLLLKGTRHNPEDAVDLLPHKVTDKMGRLWDIAHQGMRENRFLRAEKALLTILNIDKKNAAAYNRLGILYAKQKEYKDAIDCFEIASSIEPSASSLHNLGLIYYETENYHKASTAFEEALKMEEELAARHIAFAKVQEKLGNTKMMFAGLERAVELEPNHESYTLLMKAFESEGKHEEAAEVQAKLDKLIMPSGRKNKVSRPRKVVV